MRLIDGLLRLLTRRMRAGGSPSPAPSVPCEPPTVRRDVHVPPGFHAHVGDEAAKRIRRASCKERDPLGLGIDAEWAERRETDRVAHLARAVLAGTLPVPPDQPRAHLAPLTDAMLRLAGVDPDGFAALAGLNVVSGLYIDDPDGRTMLKSIDVHFDQRVPATDVTVRVRVPADRPGGPLTYWQQPGRDPMVGVPRLPSTISGLLVGRPLSDLIDLPGYGGGEAITAVEERDDFDGDGMTVVTLGGGSTS